MLRNPFEKRTDTDRKQEIARLAASQESYNKAIEKAKTCLASPLFRESHTAAQKAVLELVEVMLNLPVGDPFEYAIKMNSLAIQINALRHLGLSIANVANLPERQPVMTQNVKETTPA